jgi:hypothetical protein
MTMVTAKANPVRRAKRAAPANVGPGAGAAVDLTAPKTPTDPLMPHHRDEKVGMTGGVPSPKVQQAARDVKRGLQDTSRATEADETYKKLRK